MDGNKNGNKKRLRAEVKEILSDYIGLLNSKEMEQAVYGAISDLEQDGCL